MKIVSVDQSFCNCAVVFLNDGAIADFKIIKSDKTQDIFERAHYITNQLINITNLYKPDHVALEGLSLSNFGNATRDLAGLQFVIVSMLRFYHGYNIIIIPPKTVKKIATGNGNASKDDMIEHLPKIVREEFAAIGYKKSTGLKDLADAYWIGIACVELLKQK
jgi:Holliday junction resolvasome RuvABC endonuclease subunit